MQFVNPFFLFGLLAVAIPVIIHLFNFRRFKKVYFTNVRFIEELQQQTQKQSRLKHLIVLFLRILAVICLVLSFAQPFVPLTNNNINFEARSAVSVYLDNSFSMEARSSKGMLLEDAKNKAIEIASAYKASDIFQLLTNDFEGRHQRLVTKDEFVDLVNEVKVSPSSRKISEVILRQDELLKNAGTTNHFSYLVSDFQESVSDISLLKKDSGITRFIIPVKANQVNNLYIDSCWFETPVTQLNQQCRLKARVRNASETDFEKIPVKLLVNGTQRAVAAFDCKGEASTEIDLSFTNTDIGIQYASLEITDYPITYDDNFYFSFRVLDKFPILVINEQTENIFLSTLFGKDSSFNYDVSGIKGLDYAGLSTHNLIILNSVSSVSSGLAQELKKFLDKGGNLVIFPPSRLDVAVYAGFLANLGASSYSGNDTVTTRVAGLDPTIDIYRDVFEKIPENIDLPLVNDHYQLGVTSTSGIETILKLENGDPFLTRQSAGNGRIYLFTAPLAQEYTNFGKHALFVPTLYQIALLSHFQEKLYYTIGINEAVIYRDAQLNGEDILKIMRKQGGAEFIPEIRPVNGQVNIFVHDQVRESGNYFLLNEKEEVMGLGFNYNRLESALSFKTSETLKREINGAGLKNYFVLETKEKPLSAEINAFSKGVRYWKLFIILALLFIAAEVALLRFWN
jgi:hypothetical protein